MEEQREDKKLGVVMTAIDDLTNALEDTQKGIDRLGKKLEPVMIDEDKPEGDTLKSEDKKTVLISRMINTATAKVYDLNRQLKRFANKINI